MNKKIMCCFVLLFFFSITTLPAEDNLTSQTQTALQKAAAYFHSISTNGGYCGIYSLDLKKRYGEAIYEKARANEIWVQPPGTPTVGQCFLRAYKATGDKQYLTAARDAARALAWGQSSHGGWGHRVDVSALKPDSQKPTRKKIPCTFDDNISQGALTFLINIDQTLDEPWLDDAVQLGLDYLLKSQFKNGAWPQWYPLRGRYHDYYTYNDNSINDCIRVMLLAHKTYGEEKYLRSARLGGDFIIASQCPAPQTGWAQQYSHDLKPAWARSFEPPGVCSAATARNIRTLVDLYLYTKDENYLQPIPPALDWLDKSQITPNLWSRLYEVGTNKPIYGDRMDGNKIHYDYDQVSTREKTSYGWRSEFGVGSARAYYQRVKELGLEKFLAQRDKPLTPKQKKSRARQLTPNIKSLISQLDPKGRWITDNTIRSSTFTTNFNQLCLYLELSQ